MKRFLRTLLICALSGAGGLDDDFSDELLDDADRRDSSLASHHKGVAPEKGGLAPVFHDPECKDPTCAGIPYGSDDVELWTVPAGSLEEELGHDPDDCPLCAQERES